MELERCWGVAQDGAVIEVAVHPSLVPELERRWPPVGLDRRFEPTEPIEGRVGLSNEWIIVPDREPSGDSPPPVAWDLLEQTLTLFSAQRLTRLVAVHSAAIAHNGRVMVVPARSEGGKSTLSVAAHRAGATVLSDEYTLIDPTNGLVTGWTRPVRRRRDETEGEPDDEGEIERLDIAVPSAPMPVGLIASVVYDPDATESSGTWQPISAAEATVELLAHTICARTQPHDSLDAALHVTRTAYAVAGPRGDADIAVRELLDLLDRQPERSGQSSPSASHSAST